MNNLQEDRDEVEDPKAKRWVARTRRHYGIQPKEGACWFVYVEGGSLDGYAPGDRDWTFMSPSPGDALHYAECSTRYARRRIGIGRWILETFEDGVNAPKVLYVEPALDEQRV